MFADRPAWQRLGAPDRRPRPRVARYNLALQGFLLHADEVVVRARTHVRSVVRFARLKRLHHEPDDGSRPTLPALRSRDKKVRARLATFVPPRWLRRVVLEATCWLQAARAPLVTGPDTAMASPHALPSDTDSATERHLVRDVRRLGSEWTLRRETTAIPIGRRVFFPDFTLTRSADRVLVEIVGFYTPEYIASKLACFREAKLERFIVCVDESLACDAGAIAASRVLRFRRRVDAAALLRAADGVCREADG